MKVYLSFYSRNTFFSCKAEKVLFTKKCEFEEKTAEIACHTLLA
jgi:hypothetical protein